VESKGLCLSEETARYYSLPPEKRASAPPPADAVLLNTYFEEKHAHRQRILERAAQCPHERFRAWHSRQRSRCEAELGHQTNSAFTHLPFVLELSRGCSVGCSFCAFSSEKLSAVFRAEKEHLRLFADIVDRALSLFGDAARDAVLYYATEPLDNPDYPLFAEAFAAKMGRVPIMTTAVPLRDVQKTRAMISMNTGNDPAVHRFSVLSLEELRRIENVFSPEELLYVELLPRYAQAPAGLVHAGRGRDTSLDDSLFNTQGTVSCISGFIVNLAERTVRLSTPCRATNQHPDGALEKELGHFETADEMETLMLNCMQQMDVSPDPKRAVMIAPFLRFRPGPPCALENEGISRFLPEEGSPAARILSLLSLKSHTGAALIALLNAEGVRPLETQIALQALYQRGLLSYAQN
jgi:radical SAM family RiPP maturation amino acid epimerase